jgi:hypothetical protein
MPTYDSNLFDPPAPLARVSLRNFHTGNAVSDVPMLIDSGADLTVLPRTFVDEPGSGIEAVGGYELEGFDGRKSVAGSVQLELTFPGLTFRGRFVVLDSQKRHPGKERPKSLCYSAGWPPTKVAGAKSTGKVVVLACLTRSR